MLLDLDTLFDPDRRVVRFVCPADLPAEWVEWWNERAAIIEFDGNLLRELAERLALLEAEQQIRRNLRSGSARASSPTNLSDADA